MLTTGSQRTGTSVHVDFQCVLVRIIVCDFRPETTEHAMMCMARLVRVLLGESAISARKLDYGPSLTILGVDVCLFAVTLFMDFAV